MDGIHPKLVPNGGDILTIVQYKTDDVDHGAGNGPEHWVRVKSPENGSSYEPQDKQFQPVDIAVFHIQDLTKEEIEQIKWSKDGILLSSGNKPESNQPPEETDGNSLSPTKKNTVEETDYAGEEKDSTGEDRKENSDDHGAANNSNQSNKETGEAKDEAPDDDPGDNNTESGDLKRSNGKPSSKVNSDASTESEEEDEKEDDTDDEKDTKSKKSKMENKKEENKIDIKGSLLDDTKASTSVPDDDEQVHTDPNTEKKNVSKTPEKEKDTEPERDQVGDEKTNEKPEKETLVKDLKEAGATDGKKEAEKDKLKVGDKVGNEEKEKDILAKDQELKETTVDQPDKDTPVEGMEEDGNPVVPDPTMENEINKEKKDVEETHEASKLLQKENDDSSKKDGESQENDRKQTAPPNEDTANQEGVWDPDAIIKHQQRLHSEAINHAGISNPEWEAKRKLDYENFDKKLQEWKLLNDDEKHQKLLAEVDKAKKKYMKEMLALQDKAQLRADREEESRLDKEEKRERMDKLAENK